MEWGIPYMNSCGFRNYINIPYVDNGPLLGKGEGGLENNRLIDIQFGVEPTIPADVGFLL